MCGIVGYIGTQSALPVLLEGLSRLEYRGYDSSGVAYILDGEVNVIKKKGRLKVLTDTLAEQGLLHDPDSRIHIGIGHTRWATHGAPSDENSHPHLSASGRIAVVHNGIIENYLELKQYLQDLGIRFHSETDTEVVAHLVEHHFMQDTGRDLLAAVRLTLADIEGSYALGVLCADCPGQFIAARKDSPLIIGLGQNCNFIASDIPAILSHTRQILIMEDREIACIDKDSVRLFDNLGRQVSRAAMTVSWDSSAAEKSGYEHFMMKEIHEEPRAVRDTLQPRLRGGRISLPEFDWDRDWLENMRCIRIVACGTAYHAGMVGKFLFEQLCRIPVEVDLASEFRYRNPIIDDKTLVVIISQSGETLDTLAAMREARNRGGRILAIVNVVGSSIAREADSVIYTAAGPEIAVASTKAYNTQLAALYLIAFQLAHVLGRIDKSTLTAYLGELAKLPEMLTETLKVKDQIQRFAAEHYNARSIFFIGRGLDYALAMEASLKLKEISYIHSEAYAGGELKHGTIALIEEGTLVVCPLTQPALVDKMISNIREVKARGAVVLGILSPACRKAAEVCDTVFSIPQTDPLLSSILAVTPTQLFAYYMSVNKGLDVDKPRNLAKSVTVE
ncbi:MAG TPA: glutamine--fructose-6-phosphate transaminase (isomerizing) [Clostridiales bacterium]|nr:glutamine--fructose-6-phosphate transaminase (isomerizing) [Clostridiales bacterium]